MLGGRGGAACCLCSAAESPPEREIRDDPEHDEHDEQLDDLEVRVLPVQVQVINYDVRVLEVTVARVAMQRFAVQPEHGDHQPDDAAPQETALHDHLHDPGHLVREVEPVNGQAQERRYQHGTDRAAVLQTDFRYYKTIDLINFDFKRILYKKKKCPHFKFGIKTKISFVIFLEN